MTRSSAIATPSRTDRERWRSWSRSRRAACGGRRRARLRAQRALPVRDGRCIRQSRFVLCIVTTQYLASDHTSEEAIISKTLDMAERRRRLVPLILDRVELPVWLHGLVGIDFTAEATVNPLERLLALLTQKRATARGSASGFVEVDT